ncbi:hypothetical protein [Eggerthella timonensis]|uniref:hypothetical protein n=1 Tax=Eggerthella timonensis TaxID=1871008 RepID=UPI000C790F09|nr:hypothetical protein [Eggerthella timonensis]
MRDGHEALAARRGLRDACPCLVAYFGVRAVDVDETAKMRGRDRLSVFVDLDAKRVVPVQGDAKWG